MGCKHYESSADAAVEAKKKLNEEREKYVNAQTEINSIKTSIDSYANFFLQLGAALEDVIVNGKAFDDGDCKTTGEKIKQHGYKILEISSAIDEAIVEIDEEIEAKQKIINARWKTCWACANPPEDAQVALQ